MPEMLQTLQHLGEMNIVTVSFLGTDQDQIKIHLVWTLSHLCDYGAIYNLLGINSKVCNNDENSIMARIECSSTQPITFLKNMTF